MSDSERPTDPCHEPPDPVLALLHAIAADVAYVRNELKNALLRLTEAERRQSQTDAWIASQRPEHYNGAGL